MVDSMIVEIASKSRQIYGGSTIISKGYYKYKVRWQYSILLTKTKISGWLKNNAAEQEWKTASLVARGVGSASLTGLGL